MSTFDPAAVRQAVAEFKPRRPQRFQELTPAREVIVELRQKRASYRAIAELLTQHCLPTSKTAIAAFCHEILGEITRPKRKPNRKRPFTPAVANGNGNHETAEPAPSAPQSNLAAETPNASESEIPTARTRGPRIAQVRMLKPQST